MGDEQWERQKLGGLNMVNFGVVNITVTLTFILQQPTLFGPKTKTTKFPQQLSNHHHHHMAFRVPCLHYSTA